MILSFGDRNRRAIASVRRRDHIRLRALLVFGRWWLAISPPAILIIVALDLRHLPAPLWSQAPFAGVVLFNILATWHSVHDRKRHPHPARLLDRTYVTTVLCCGLLGCLWGLTLIVAGTTIGRLFQIFLIPTLIYGGILMAPVRAGAIAYVVFVTTGYLLSWPADAVGATGSRLLAIIYGLASVVAIIWQHAEFARGIDNEMMIEDRGETIGIRLHEFEEQGSDWLWETDARFRLQAPSERLCTLLGCENHALGNMPLRRWINSRMWLTTDGREGFVTLADCLDERLPFRSVQIPVGTQERERWLLLTGKPILEADGTFRGYRGVGSDITGIRDSERRIIWLARHDSLTGLANRAHFHEALHTACSLQAETGEQMALLCLDLDGFKAINDTLGHLSGDALLAQVAARLSSCVRKRDLVGRLGGDEFAVLLVDTDRAAAGEFARRLMAHVSEPYKVDGTTIGVGLSIGIMLSPDDAVDTRDLLKGADLAMYRAKAGGRGIIRFFDTKMETSARNRLLLQADLRHAINRNEIALHFQPIMHGITGRVVAVEALARWMHPSRGMIPPAEFIPIAEEFGLITDLGAWVLHEACMEATLWPETIGV
ncbi:MAG: putative bifunctional diguanylate cyclase/phosphodiesterase, partial [Janthinobacterium lividum]